MTHLTENLELREEEEVNTCKDIIFKAKKNDFINSKGEYISSIRMTPLKKKSCSGCERCDWKMGMLRDFLSCDTPPILDVDHDRLYTLQICNESRGWETGVVDNYDLAFMEVKLDA